MRRAEPEAAPDALAQGEREGGVWVVETDAGGMRSLSEVGRRSVG